MRKWLVVMLLFLTGCSVSQTQLTTALSARIESVFNDTTVVNVNEVNPLYRFYMPKGVGKRFSNQVASIVVSHDVEVMLAVDVANIIMQRYYRTQLVNNMRVIPSKESLIFQQTGLFNHINGDLLNYDIQIANSDEEYSILIRSNYFMLSAQMPLAKVEPVLFDMLVMLKTAEASRDVIVASVSNKQVVNYQQQTVEMFQQIAPESGTIGDMIRIMSGQLDFAEFIREGEDEFVDIADDVVDRPD